MTLYGLRQLLFSLVACGCYSNQLINQSINRFLSFSLMLPDRLVQKLFQIRIYQAPEATVKKEPQGLYLQGLCHLNFQNIMNDIKYFMTYLKKDLISSGFVENPA